MTSRLNTLIADNYSVQSFDQLQKPHQLAIAWFMAVDGDAWGEVDLSAALNAKDQKAALADLLPQFVQKYGDSLFGTANLKPADLQQAVMGDEDIAGDFSSWEEYHTWYLASDVPEHPDTCRWPVILSGDDSETLRDGWHRFHSYMRAGAADIPAVFFPKEHHLTAR